VRELEIPGSRPTPLQIARLPDSGAPHLAQTTPADSAPFPLMSSRIPVLTRWHGLCQIIPKKGRVMKTKKLQSFLLAVVLGSFVAGCASYRAELAGKPVPTAPPPAPKEVDVTTPMPGPNYVWINGAWVWGQDNQWDWLKGRWDQPPFISAHWVPPHCENRDGKYLFFPGQWH
jgi:hypothetical protein